VRTTKDGYSSIRRARTVDARALTTLLHAAYAEHLVAGLNFTAGLQSESQTALEIHEREVHAIRSQTEFVATITLAKQAARDGSARIYINHLAVLPSARNAGLSGRLLDHAERIARRRHIPVLRLDTASSLPKLIERYSRRGSRVIGERQWPGKTYRSVLMEKVLAYRKPSAKLRSPAVGKVTDGARRPRV
jgi:ribosomal protein S18 acetylase RimI-like enzyme